MKVICDRAALLETLNIVSGAITPRTTKPILLCVRMLAQGRRLTVSATDLEVAIRLATDKVDIEEEGEVVINADKIIQICRESTDATLTLVAKDQTAQILGVDSKFTVFCSPTGDFPPLPEIENGRKPDFIIEGGQLSSLIDRTRFATAKENSRYAINGVLVKRKGKKVEFVATDGRRLALARGSCISAVEGDSQSIVPSKPLGLLPRLVSHPDDKVQAYLSENQVIFTVDQVGGEGSAADEPPMLSTIVVEGTFPPYEDVIPRDLDKKVAFNLDKLTSAVRRAALLTNEESKGVRMNFAKGELTITSRAPEMGEAEISVQLERYDGEDVEIGFNPNFITDALKVVPNEEVIFELKSPNKPGMLKSGNDFVYVLMPVSLS